MAKPKVRMIGRDPKQFAGVLRALFDTHRKRTGETVTQLAAAVAPNEREPRPFHQFLRRASSAGVKIVHGGNRQKLNAVLERVFRLPRQREDCEKLFEMTAAKIVEKYESARAAYEERRGKLEWLKTHEALTYWTIALAIGQDRTDELAHWLLDQLPKSALQLLRDEAAKYKVVRLDGRPIDMT